MLKSIAFALACMICLFAGQIPSTFQPGFTVSSPSVGSLAFDNCNSTFVRRIGNDGSSEEAWFLLPLPNGNFLIGGRENDHSLLLQVDGAGEIIWQRTFDFTFGNDFIRHLMLDSEGYLIGSARDELDAYTLHYIFKYDWQNDNFIWVRNLPDPGYTRIEGMLEKPANGNYLLYGMTNPGTYDNYILEIDRNTGAAQWQRQFDFGGNTDIFQAHVVKDGSIYFANAERLGDGLEHIRPAIAKMDFAGNLAWTRTYFVPSTQSARVYNEDILLENDTLVCVSRGNLSSDDLYNGTLQLFKTDLEGKLLWGKNYAINGGNAIWMRHIHAVPGGYILQGNYLRNGWQDAFFMRVDKAGNVVWAKRMGTEAEDFVWSSALAGDFIAFAAHSSGFDLSGNFDILFGKIALDGSVPTSNCDLFQPIQVTVNNISGTYDGLQMPVEQWPTYSWNAADVASSSTNLALNELPGCECTEIFDPCDTLEIQLGADSVQLCAGFPLTFSVGGFDHYQWSPATGIDCDTCSTVTLSPVSNTTYSIIGTNDEGCSDTASLTVILTSEIFTSETLTLCVGDTSLVFGEPVSQPGQFSQTFVSFSGCDSTHDVTVEMIAGLFLQLPADLSIEIGETVTLDAITQQPDLQFNWTPADWLSCTDCPNPVAQPLQSIVYTLTITNPQGCSESEAISIMVDTTAGVYAPNVFSPNGDGFNDYFYLQGEGIAEIRLLRIFDRWGELVFEGENFPPNDERFGWDGVFRKKPLDPAVFAWYAYVVFADGTVATEKGDVTLLR